MAAKSLVYFASLTVLLSSVLAATTPHEALAATAELAPPLPDITVTGAAACPTLNTTVEPGICAECKASPYTLALNIKAYDYEEKVTIVGQTKGERINCNSIWFKTSDGCWVSQWDVTVADKTNSTSKFCREDAPDLDITKRYTTLKYKSECYDNAYRATDEGQRIKMFKEGTDLTLICKSSDFYKTTQDCFVEAQNLDGFTDGGDLPDCGPQVLLREPKMRQPDTTDTSCPVLIDPDVKAPNRTTSAAPHPVRDVEAGTATRDPKRAKPPNAIPTSSAPHYLVNTTIGEDKAACLNCPKTDCRKKKTYNFGTTVTIQCYSGDFLLTTDFCYLNNTLVDYQVQSGYLFPACDDFVDTNDNTI